MFDSDDNSGFIDGGGNIAGHFADISLLSRSKNGYSELYKAKRYGQWFVLKRLTAEAAGDVGCRNVLHKEFLIGSSLDHPYIGKTISMEQVEGLGECVVEEYVDGMDWEQFFGQARPSRKETLRVVGELCDALGYLHSKQLTHRDLKPSNVMITHNGHHVKLIDFGLADSDSFDLLKRVNGTRRYAAPELSVNGGDWRSDIYSLGVMLGELPKGWPRLRRVARHCRRANPTKRYASAAEVTAALRSGKGIAIVLSVAVFALAAALLWFFVVRERGDDRRQAEPDTTQTVAGDSGRDGMSGIAGGSGDSGGSGRAGDSGNAGFSGIAGDSGDSGVSGEASIQEEAGFAGADLDNIARGESARYIAGLTLRPTENTLKGWQTLIERESSRLNAAAARTLATQVAQAAKAPASEIERLTETIYKCFFDTVAGLHQLALRVVPPGTRGTKLYGVRNELMGQIFYFTEDEINQAYWVDGDGAKLKRELNRRLKKEGWPDDAMQAAAYDMSYAQHLDMIRSHLPECQKKLDAMTFEQRYLFKAKWFHGLKADESATRKSRDEQLKFLKRLF